MYNFHAIINMVVLLSFVVWQQRWPSPIGWLVIGFLLLGVIIFLYSQCGEKKQPWDYADCSAWVKACRAVASVCISSGQAVCGSRLVPS
jgi:uncharacterized membrane protein YhhN